MVKISVEFKQQITDYSYILTSFGLYHVPSIVLVSELWEDKRCDIKSIDFIDSTPDAKKSSKVKDCIAETEVSFKSFFIGVKSKVKLKCENGFWKSGAVEFEFENNLHANQCRKFKFEISPDHGVKFTRDTP